MPTDHRAELAGIKRFDQLLAYLRDKLGWPIERIEIDELMFDYTPEELGIDNKNAAKIQQIKRLRPLSPRQPWGIFFVKFEPKKLPVVALRRILSQIVLKKRPTARAAGHASWAADDLLFVSAHGDGEERRISFAHFSIAEEKEDLPVLKVIDWSDLRTSLHVDEVARQLTTNLAWPADTGDAEGWRKKWRSAFSLRHGQVVKTSKDLSIRLAELARAIRDRIKDAIVIETDRGDLTKLMKAFQEALVHDLDADGFADMYAQTIAYGVLSARVADPHKKTADDFAGHMRTNPLLRELMETFLHVGGRRGKAGGPGIDFDELGVSEVVELLDDPNTHMEAVVHDFGDKNPQEDPVIHFYELFLKEYDAKKRMKRGVFYTPRPVVSYIVRSVDELLRTEFDLEDGLADTTTWGEMVKRHKDLKIPEGVAPEQGFVHILDPACGTGTFLVEVIDLIHKTLVSKWEAQGHGEKQIEALWNEYVPTHLLPRLHGYELLMAPYAIAHLKIGLKLYESHYRFGSDERARIYLTNALEPASDIQLRTSMLPALADEAKAVNGIKRRQRFTVVVGNPPYSASVSEPQWLIDELDAWKEGLNEAKSDLRREEWKFLRMAQLLCGAAPYSVIGVIINRDFLDGIAKRKLRESLQATFAHRRLVDLNGDVKGNVADENVFDITQGVAIALLCRGGKPGHIVYSLQGTRQVKYSLLSEKWELDARLAAYAPQAPYFRWIPFASGAQAADIASEYAAWFSINEMFGVCSSGIQTKNDPICIGWTASEIFDRVSFLAEATPAHASRELGISGDGAWSVTVAREDVRAFGLSKKHVRRILYRPFDWRFTYFTKKSGGFLGRPRFEVMQHMADGTNIGLIFNRQVVGDSVSQFGVSRDLICHGTFYLGNKGQDYLAPLHLLDDGELKLGEGGRPHNFTVAFLAVLRKELGPQASKLRPEEIFHYVYAVVHSRTYRARYGDHLKLDFPRVPLASRLRLFRTLADRGGELVSLHLMESPKLDDFITTYTGPKNPEVGRVGWSDDTVWLHASAAKKGQPVMSGAIGFRGVPEVVWNFHIGGYQVCRKWLKDRKGRTLSDDDIAHYQKIVVALAETIRLMKEIDEVIERHGGWPGAFQTGDGKAVTAEVTPFRPPIVEPKPQDRYVTCVPLVPLKAAAGAFSDPQHIEDDGWEWVAVDTKRRLHSGMFVAQVVGKSMEPVIPDGAYCLFAAPVTGTRQGKTVLVQLRDATDPETGERYTVKRYESEKTTDADSWHHAMITLKPVNPDFQPIVLSGAEQDQLQVVAELIEVLSGKT